VVVGVVVMVFCRWSIIYRERKPAKLEGKGEGKADADVPSFFDRSCRRMPLASSSRFGFGPPLAVACLSRLAAARPLV